MRAFEFTYRVHLDDLDYLNHVGNAQWLRFLERARVEMLDKIELPLPILLERKVFCVVAEATIRYQKPAKLGEQLCVCIVPVEPFSKGLKLDYRVTGKDGSPKLEAKYTMVFIDETGRSTAMPADLRERLFG